jgi:ABC-2 type transport system ATP-binding protein
VAIIDHGRIIASGSPKELITETGKDSLEEAFLALTGRSIREEEVGTHEAMRMNRRLWARR